MRPPAATLRVRTVRNRVPDGLPRTEGLDVRRPVCYIFRSVLGQGRTAAPDEPPHPPRSLPHPPLVSGMDMTMLHTFENLIPNDASEAPDVVPAGLALPTRNLDPGRRALRGGPRRLQHLRRQLRRAQGGRPDQPRARPHRRPLRSRRRPRPVRPRRRPAPGDRRRRPRGLPHADRPAAGDERPQAARLRRPRHGAPAAALARDDRRGRDAGRRPRHARLPAPRQPVRSAVRRGRTAWSSCRWP
jgi:hypothetical protein